MLSRKQERIKKIPFYYLLFYKVILCTYISDRKPENTPVIKGWQIVTDILVWAFTGNICWASGFSERAGLDNRFADVLLTAVAGIFKNKGGPSLLSGHGLCNR